MCGSIGAIFCKAALHTPCDEEEEEVRHSSKRSAKSLEGCDLVSE
jgi:hypothetical protein